MENLEVTQINISHLPATKLEKSKYIAIIVYILFLIASVVVIERYIKEKRNRLESELFDTMGWTLNKSSMGLMHESLDNVKYKEVPIPSYPKDPRKQQYWKNMFSGIQHVYKLTDEGWIMSGMIFQIVENGSGNYGPGIQDFTFSPYMICVPKGVEFNKQIAINIIGASLKMNANNADDSNIDGNVRSLSNEYFKISGINITSSKHIPFHDEQTGTDPIYENGKFDDKFWFGMDKIGPYRIILSYSNQIAWSPEEKKEASMKDRMLYYSILDGLFTILFVFSIFFITKRISASKLFLKENLMNRLLRISNPIIFIKSNPQFVTIARDIQTNLNADVCDTDKLVMLASQVKHSLKVNLISDEERKYLFDICKIYSKRNKNKNIEISDIINNLIVLVSDTNSIDGESYIRIKHDLAILQSHF